MKKGKSIISLIISILIVLSQLTANNISVMAMGDSLRIATFNTNGASDIEELLVDNGIDIAGLQEVDNELLESLNAHYTYSSYNADYRMGMVSSLELNQVSGDALYSEDIENACGYQRVEVLFNNQTIAIYNIQLTNEDQSVSEQQLEELKTIVDNDETEYKIILGDFNTDQDTSELDIFLENYKLTNGYNDKWYETYNEVNANMNTYAIDNIITTLNLEVNNITMIETTLSDHNLFYVDITLLEEEEVSRDYLDKLVAEANELDEDLYSEDSWNLLDKKLVVGELLDDTATQEDIDLAASDIEEAMNNLEDRYPNLALNKEVSVSGLEVSDGRFTADLAVDGDTSTRVSFAKDVDEQWLLIDLGQLENVSYFVINYESQAPAFKIQVSSDGNTFSDVYEVSGLSGGESTVLEIEIDSVEARYIKYVQEERWTHTNGKKYSGSIYEFEVYEANPSSLNYDNLALNQNVSVSGLEVSDGRFTADLAVDGDTSFAKDTDEQWLLIDLGTRKTVSKFIINYESQAPAFKIQVSTDGVHYSDVYEVSGLTGQISNIQEITIDPIKAHYVKYVQLERWTHSSNGKQYSGSIYEFEIYKNYKVDTASEVLKTVSDIQPEIVDNQLVLPEVPDGFEISLYGCDNQQVVALDGTISQPLEDMDINILYQITNLNDATDIAYSDTDINFIVAGQYSKDESINDRPNVLPGLREWKGNEGNFVLTSTSKIVVKDDSLMDTAKQIQFYLEEMIDQSLSIVTSGETKGDIVLIKDASVDNLGEEGYTLDIDDYIEVRSNYETGILYGGVSIVQILSQDETQSHIAKGLVRDYPKYEVRAGMIDVARTYIPLEYLEEMTIYMAYYKLNEIQVHINDYWSATNYSAFRLECETYPEITATDGSYSKEEYKQYQIDMKTYGIDVITEIDTPYHSECFRNIDGVVMLSTGALDIREESSYEIIENILDEYLDGGDEAVIQSDKFHIGTDEYDKTYSEEMRQWTDHFINYVNDKGYETRLWGSLGSRGFDGTTEVSTDATVNLWAPYWADVEETYEAGYDVINTCGGWLYIVPGANAGYPDRLDIESLYDNFDVNNFAPSRNYGQGTSIMPVAHPQTKGAEFAVWNDMTSYGGGFSWFDIYDRFIDAVMIVSEKTWYGEKTTGQTSEEFMERVESLKSTVPGANPGRVVDSETELVTSIDFKTISNNLAIDYSGNNYDATLNNVTITNINGSNVASFNSDGYLSLPYDSIGYPYTVMMDIYLDENTPANTEIFSGEDGILYANINDTGQIGYSRGSYNFTFDYELPTNTWVNIALTCDQKDTTLYINGECISTGINMATAINNRNDSTTFVLPTEKIMNNGIGYIDNLNIYNYTMTESQINDLLGYVTIENLALNKPASASSVYPDSNLTADLAVDGDNTKSSTNRWSSKRATGTGSNDDDSQYGTVEQYLLVDLEDVYKVDRVYISWESAYAKTYVIQGSLDGETFFDIKTVDNGTGGEETHDNLGNVETRYIRILCQSAYNSNWGYSIYELEVYQNNNEVLRQLVEQGLSILAQYESGHQNGQINEETYSYIESTLNEYLDLATGEQISDQNINKMLTDVTNIINSIESYIIYSNTELEELYDEATQYQAKDYTKDSFAGFDEKLAEIKILINEADDYIKVNEATDQLNALIESLVTLDRTSLKAELDKYNDLNENNYTTSSYQEALTIIQAAQEVYNNESVNQSDIDDALLKLQTIQLIERGDITVLHAIIDSINKDNYTEDSWNLFDSTYQEAVAMIQDNSNISQDDVDNMIQRINEAITLLVLKNNETIDISTLLQKYNDILKDIQNNNYDDTSLSQLQDVLDKVQALLSASDITQADVDALIDELDSAYKALVLVEEIPQIDVTSSDNQTTSVSTADTTSYEAFIALFLMAGIFILLLNKKKQNNE